MKKIGDFLHHFFVPKPENNFRAKSVHVDFLSYYLLFALVLTFTFKTINNRFNSVLGFATDISVEKLYQLTNQEREKQGLSDLTYNEQLAEAAKFKAEDMFSKNYWAHYSPTGSTPWDFILNAGYKYEYAGENLAKNFLFSNGVVNAWMNSPTHKENILRKEYSEVGFAIVNGTLNGEETTLVVQMFGKPMGPGFMVKKTEAAEKTSEVVKPAVLAKSSNGKKINIFNLPFNLDLIFLSFLIIALFFDFYFAAKFNIVRVSGKNLAHIIFALFIFGGILMFARGAIL